MSLSPGRSFPTHASPWLVVLLASALLAASTAQAQTVTTTVPAGSYPASAAVNPVTNKIYVANYSGGTVTVIDGATNTTTTVTAGGLSYAVVVNPRSATRST